MTTGRVSVHFIFPANVSRESARACLTHEEKARADLFRFPQDAIHWVACRASLRNILGHAIQLPAHEVPLVLSEFEKPLLAPPYDRLHFNLSHSRRLALVAVCQEGPVGIDLESLDRATDLLECEATFCHPEEISALPIERVARASHLLRIWTAKEAVLKSLGTGLHHPPDGIRIRFQDPCGMAMSDSPLIGIEDQRLYELEHPALAGYRAMLSASTTAVEIEMIC